MDIRKSLFLGTTVSLPHFLVLYYTGGKSPQSWFICNKFVGSDVFFAKLGLKVLSQSIWHENQESRSVASLKGHVIIFVLPKFAFLRLKTKI